MELSQVMANMLTSKTVFVLKKRPGNDLNTVFTSNKK